MLQGVHSQILHAVRKSQTINSACSQCESKNRAPGDSGLRSGSGQRGVREKLLRERDLGPAWSRRDGEEGQGLGPPMWTMASRDSAQPSSLGLLYLCPEICLPGRLVGPSCRATKARPSLYSAHTVARCFLSCSCLMVDWQLPDRPHSLGASSSPSFDTQGFRLWTLSLTSALLQLSSWAPLSNFTSGVAISSDSFLLFSLLTHLFPSLSLRCRPFLPRV